MRRDDVWAAIFAALALVVLGWTAIPEAVQSQDVINQAIRDQLAAQAQRLDEFAKLSLDRRLTVVEQLPTRIDGIDARLNKMETVQTGIFLALMSNLIATFFQIRSNTTRRAHGV